MKKDILKYLVSLIVIMIVVVGVIKYNSIHQKNKQNLDKKTQNTEIEKRQGKNIVESSKLYKCKEGDKLYTIKVSDDVMNMSIIHADDTYSSVILKRKKTNDKEVFADEYNHHKFEIENDNTASFVINGIKVATMCTSVPKKDIKLPEVAIDSKIIKDFSNRMDYMFYGDPAINRVVAMKLSTFEKVGELKIDGKNVYCVDHVSDEKSYIMPRDSNFVQVIKGYPNDGFKLGKKIELPFHPRTGAKNEFLDLELITSKNKGMFALLDLNTDKVLYVGGENKVTHITAAYGGSNATGHGVWLSANYFMFSDRAKKEISLYHVLRKESSEIEVKKTDSLVLPLTIHTFFDVKRQGEGMYNFYATLEGTNDNNKHGGIVELFAKNGKLIKGRIVIASGGVHHAEAHPTQDVLYVPTGSGYLDIVDEKTFKIIKSIKVGKGSGHVVWVTEKNIAIVINHTDTFISIIDMNNHEKIKDIEVAKDSADYDTILQSHSTRLSPDDKYYYGFATDSGTFFRVDLDKLELEKKLYVGGTPKQASQPSQLND